jgi:broad specificity phosphatase PhoE
MSGTEIYVVRHGRTALNAAGVLRGRLDPPLDDGGEDEARALGDLFSAVTADAVVSSPLLRARQTAQPIADATGVLVSCDEAFVDRDYGAWAGRTRAEIEAAYGAVDRALGIEPMGSLVSRALFAARAHASHAHATVIVSHDVVNRALLARLAANTPDDADVIPQRTGCWNKLEHVDGNWLATVVDALPGDGQQP